VTARFLAARRFPSIRRVVRIPKRWDRIVDLAAEYDFKLPAAPSSKALNKFLSVAKKADPLRFPDLSLNVIKLMGAGEYALEMPGVGASGHFGLAVRDYAHSTAPNRRYPDLITQRLLKAAMADEPVPYSRARLEALAQHCTDMEDAAKKVERQVEKSAAAALLRTRIGETFEAIVTGVADAGVWVRLLEPPVEGKLVEGRRGMQVGDALQVRLLNANVERGFVDFQQVEKGRGRAPAQLSDRRNGFRRKARRGASGAKGKTGRKRPRKMR
jgi:exoribonuclease-2